MKKIIIAISAAVLLVGCAPNTTTTLKMNAMTGEVSWSNPKDTTIQSLTASGSTNGMRSVQVTGFSTLNNPAVVSAVGAAQANSITATGAAATQILNAVNTAAGAGVVGAVTGK